MKFFRVIIYNFSVFIFFIILLEAIFGFWFKKENFVIYMRKERKLNWETTSSFYGKEFKFFCQRNFWGFRGEEFDPKDVRVVLRAEALEIRVTRKFNNSWSIK